MADPAAGSPEQRFLTFRIAETLYALPADEVVEVIHVPPLARVPQGPAGLLGMANLRGSVIPVASGRGLLGREAQTPERAIVLDGPAQVALAVDRVENLVAVSIDRIETGQGQLASLPGERLRGAFQADAGGEAAKVLDVWPMLQAAFVQAPRPLRARASAASGQGPAEGNDDQTAERLVTFDLAGQEFALPLDAVQEIIPAPANVIAAPRAEAVLLGVAAHRDRLLPLLSLRGLLGLPMSTETGELQKVLVTRVGGGLVGLVADRMRAIVPADPALLEPTPPMLAARTGGESRIQAIYRGEGGRRLISVLAVDQLFREDVMARLGGTLSPDIASEPATPAGETRRLLVFHLGGDEFGLPIEVVDEVAPAPAQITRVPKTPKFLEGVINLRGEVLPVVDQRRRFDMPPSADPAARRLVVVRTERHRAGLIVDSVSEVLQIPAEAIEPAPDLTGEAVRLVQGVINLDQAGRLILLLDPAELLTRAERGLLDAFQADGSPPRP